MPDELLPPQFAALTPFVTRWAKPTEGERFATRVASSLEDLDALYQAMLPQLDNILAYLSDKPADLESLTPEDRNLAHLAMAAMENSRAVEVWRKVDVHSANFAPSRIHFHQ